MSGYTTTATTCVSVPLGGIAGSRSGDKGGNATLGIWALSEEAHEFLSWWWTEDNAASLLTATNIALDTQAKGLGEFVRARHLTVPRSVVESVSRG